LFILGTIPILRHYVPDTPPLLETDASDCAIAGIVSQKFQDVKVHPLRVVSMESNPVQLNYDMHDKEMPAVVDSLNENRHCLQGTAHRTIICSDNRSLMNFNIAIFPNRQQARCAEQLKHYNFELLYRKGTSNTRADILSRCPAFTSKEGGTTSATNHTMLQE